MKRTFFFGCLFAAATVSACGSDDGNPLGPAGSSSTGSGAASSTASSGTAGGGTSAGGGGSGADGGSGGGGGASCGTPSECAVAWEQAASDKFDVLVAGSPDALATFLKEVPKGGDLHNHLTGAVYAETYLDWAKADGDCINTTTFAAVYSGQCSASTQPVPTMGTFYDDIVGAWSMEGFVPGIETGHDHFFATFGKFGAVAGAHREDTLADVAIRAADENELYVETMFNLGKNVGTLAASVWSGTVTAADLPSFYSALMASPTFTTELAQDVQAVNDARAGYQAALGCDDLSPPEACEVEMRFIAQVSRTGANDNIFGQLVSAFEMAAQTKWIVGANLSSPEDETSSLTNYNLHMAMLDFLYQQYSVSELSPLQITLHAGELTQEYLPPGFADADTFHIREAVHTGHAKRIGHGLDILSETDSQGLMDEMRQLGVLVEVCLSSNVQILEVSGADHPLAQYLQNDVPVALATDDQGVSRSSMAGEYMRAALDQQLDYRQLKTMARNSLEHAFLPGDSLWSSVATAEPIADCAATDTMGLGETPNATCQAFLDGSERARMQWKLEGRFRQFESKQ
jgi:adenosine deaminase